MLNIYKLKKNNIKNDIVVKKEGKLSKDILYDPAYSREWYNSVYTFNKNTVKSLPSNDIYVSKLIKTYFNSFSKKLEIKSKLYTTGLKNRIAKTNKIFIGKPEFKHTNEKVVITIYIYNQELLSYISKMKKIENLAFLKVFKSKLINTNIKSKNNIFASKLYLIKKIYAKFLKNINNLNIKYLNKVNLPFFNIENFYVISLVKDMLVKLRLYLDLKRIIHINKSKFNSIHILFLKNSLKKIYRKDVEFNIVSLKHYRLNSSILNQILAIKLKKRRTPVTALLDEVLYKFNMPYRRKLEIPSNKYNFTSTQNLIIRNNLNNNYVKKIPYVELLENKKFLSENNLNKLFIKKINNDKFNSYLKSLYPNQYLINLSSNNEIFIKSRNLENTVLDNIKNKIINGIRIEAAGRLSKRKSGRSSFDFKYKGTIRNVYSSYRNVSSVLLRGSSNYNVDFIKSDNKGNLGSFGIKGWISSM